MNSTIQEKHSVVTIFRLLLQDWNTFRPWHVAPAQMRTRSKLFSFGIRNEWEVERISPWMTLDHAWLICLLDHRSFPSCRSMVRLTNPFSTLNFLIRICFWWINF
jgi:hypothetical protein